MLQALSLAAKFGAPTLKRIYKTQLIGDGSVIPLTIEEIEYEKVYCPIFKSEISRQKCLDYSGEEAHYDECKICSVGVANKKLLRSFSKV